MLRSVGVLACSLLMLAACGDGAPTPTDSAAGLVSTSTIDVSTTSSATVVAALEVSPCDLLTPDEVLAATGLAVEEVRDEPPITCVFDLRVDAGVDVYVTVDDGRGRLGGPAAAFEPYTALIESARPKPFPA